MAKFCNTYERIGLLFISANQTKYLSKLILFGTASTLILIFYPSVIVEKVSF